MANPADFTTSHVKIANGQTTSGEVDCRGKILLAIQTPAALTGNTLAFQAAEKPTAEGGTYVDVKDRKSTRLNSSHIQKSRMPSSA